MTYFEDAVYYIWTLGPMNIFNSIQFNSVYLPIKGPQGATGKLHIYEICIDTGGKELYDWQYIRQTQNIYTHMYIFLNSP